jgi:hypothetical protein
MVRGARQAGGGRRRRAAGGGGGRRRAAGGWQVQISMSRSTHRAAGYFVRDSLSSGARWRARSRPHRRRVPRRLTGQASRSDLTSLEELNLQARVRLRERMATGTRAERVRSKSARALRMRLDHPAASRSRRLPPRRRPRQGDSLGMVPRKLVDRVQVREESGRHQVQPPCAQLGGHLRIGVERVPDAAELTHFV